MAVTPETVREALKPVVDPEVNISIVDLGLLREIEVKEGGNHVKVNLTLTSPMCPMGPQIVEAVRSTTVGMEGVNEAEVELVWEPPWDPRRDATEDVKAQFGIWDDDDDDDED